MRLNTPAMRISIALVLLIINLLFLANVIGFIPDRAESALELRKILSESLAMQFSAAADDGEFQTIQNTLRAVVARNEEIRSAAIRTADGKLIALAGEHLAHWEPPVDGKSTPSFVHVPIYREGKNWATVEIRFAPLWTNSLSGGFTGSFAGLLIFIGSSSFICFFFVLKRTMRALDPSAVIPERVRRAFDVMREGVLFLDEKEQIVMSNKAFSGLLGKPPEALVGLKGSELGWLGYKGTSQTKQLPWIKALRDDLDQNSGSLSLVSNHGGKIKLSVNTAALKDDSGKWRGSLVTFDDITQLEEQNYKLSDLVEQLELTKDEIQVKNVELEFFANRDPLTSCLNRRSLTSLFDVLFTEAKAAGTQLSCLMADIDFFKSVNDRYGHATGDQTIKEVAEVLKNCTRDSDLVGRYGGEEYCVVLPGLNQEKAAKIAERMRQEVEKNTFGGVQITISVGVSSLEQNAGQPDDLINQADKALYLAKKGGRNQVVQWGKDNAPEVSESVAVEAEQVNLERRVQELEGLLEKRTLEYKHYEMYDSQSGLPTRPLFADRMSHEIARSKRSNSLAVVLSISIDTINRVYKTLGISAAEHLVKACGYRLNDVLREDVDMVAVVGDLENTTSVSLLNQSEFGILLSDIKNVDHVTWVVKRLLNAFDKPFQVKGQEVYTTAYIGVSIYPFDGDTAEALYDSAVSACNYVEKAKGGSRHLFSSKDINAAATRQLQIESNLHVAIDNDELELHFQPQVKTSTKKISGFEALLRWRSSQLGNVTPDEFIPIAEQSGLINRIGDWVFEQACSQLRNWLDAGVEVGSVSVNLSSRQLQQQDLVCNIQALLNKFNLEPHRLEIELTESSMMNYHDKSVVVLEQIKALGVRVTMDDFGTGYSSIAYLKDIPLSCVKIDRSFVSDVGKNKNSEKLIAMIISMAHSLDLEVVGEGVETQSQADHLIALGCDYLQGYLYGRPAPQTDVTRDKLLADVLS